MKRSLFFLLAFSLPTLSGCAPTDYMDKNPSSLPYNEKIWGYNQAASHHNYVNYVEEEKFIRYFQSHMSPEEYILFSYLESPGVGMGPNAMVLTGEARKLAMESNNFPIFNHDGSSSIYYTKNTATSRIVESGITAYGPRVRGIIEGKAVYMAVKLAKKGNPIACRYLNVEDAGSWLFKAKAYGWPNYVSVSKKTLKQSLADCANAGFNTRHIDGDFKKYEYYKIDKNYNRFFYSQNHINGLIRREQEQAIKYCSGVPIPEHITNNLLYNSTSSDRNFTSSKNQAPLAEWKQITYRRWIAVEVSNEFGEISQGIPMSIKTTPIVIKDVCKEIKMADSE